MFNLTQRPLINGFGLMRFELARFWNQLAAVNLVPLLIKLSELLSQSQSVSRTQCLVRLVWPHVCACYRLSAMLPASEPTQRQTCTLILEESTCPPPSVPSAALGPICNPPHPINANNTFAALTSHPQLIIYADPVSHRHFWRSSMENVLHLMRGREWARLMKLESMCRHEFWRNLFFCHDLGLPC